MRVVRLYGTLKKFGREFTLDVKTPAEAIRALCVQLKGFRQHLSTFSEPGYIVRVGEEDRGEDELGAPCSQREVIKIIPVTSGASAGARIIIGAALIVAGYLTAPVNPWAPYMIMTGASMVIGGVAEMLAPTPKTTASNNKSFQPSYMFDGPVNTVGTGYAVSVGYGELLIGSHVVSGEIYAVEEAVSVA